MVKTLWPGQTDGRTHARTHTQNPVHISRCVWVTGTTTSNTNFLNGHNYSHLLVELIRDSLWTKSFTNHLARSHVWVQVILAGICNFSRMPVKTRILFTKDTVGSLKSSSKCSRVRHLEVLVPQYPVSANASGLDTCLNVHLKDREFVVQRLACEASVWQLTAKSADKPKQDSSTVSMLSLHHPEIVQSIPLLHDFVKYILKSLFWHKSSWQKQCLLSHGCQRKVDFLVVICETIFHDIYAKKNKEHIETFGFILIFCNYFMKNQSNDHSLCSPLVSEQRWQHKHNIVTRIDTICCLQWKAHLLMFRCFNEEIILASFNNCKERESERVREQQSDVRSAINSFLPQTHLFLNVFFFLYFWIPCRGSYES